MNPLGTGVAGVLYECGEHVKCIFVLFLLIFESDIAQNAFTGLRQRTRPLPQSVTGFSPICSRAPALRA